MLRAGKHFSQLARRRGSILILSAVIFTTILVMAGVVIDLGTAYVRSSELQKTADAAAFAAATLLPIPVSTTEGLTKQAQAEALARDYLAKNDSGEAVFAGIDFGDSFTDEVDGELYTSVRVRLQRQVNYVFGPIVNLDSATLEKHAKVRLEAVMGGVGLAPLGISKVRRDSTTTGQPVAITFDTNDDEVINGNFGSLDLNGSGGGANEFEEHYINGYLGDIVFNDPNDPLQSQTGVIFGKAKSGFDARYNACTHFPDQGGCTKDHFVANCPRVIVIIIYERVTESPPHLYMPLGIAPYILDRLDNKELYVYPITARVKFGNTVQINSFNYDFGLFRTRLVE